MSDLAKSMVAVQSRILSVNKDGRGYGYTYATLGNVLETLYPVMTEHGLSVMQMLDNIGGEMALRTIILHVGGERIESVFPVEKAGVKGINDAQQIGAAITYMRRYSVCAAFGLITEDDDAACLNKKPEQPRQPAPKPTGSLEDRAKGMTAPAKPDGEIPKQVLGVLDGLDTMDAVTAKCKEYKPMAVKEGWDKGLFRYWQARDDGFKALQKEVFGE